MMYPQEIEAILIQSATLVAMALLIVVGVLCVKWKEKRKGD